MSTLEFSQLSFRKKSKITQGILEEMRGRLDGFEVPQTHWGILEERRRRIDSEESKLLDWLEIHDLIGTRWLQIRCWTLAIGSTRLLGVTTPL
jgi:hypothetical protein